MLFDTRQISAAIALIGLNDSKLANALAMDKGQLSNILSGKTKPHVDTQRKITRKLEDLGVEFTHDGGVRPRNSNIAVYEGADGWKLFSDDRYQTATNSMQDFLSCGGTNEAFISAAGEEHYKFHAARMRTIEHFKIRALRPLSDTQFVDPTGYVEYRGIPDEQFPDTSFYVYGGKLALMCFEPTVKVYVIQDRAISTNYRKMFEGLWAAARPLRGK